MARCLGNLKTLAMRRCLSMLKDNAKHAIEPSGQHTAPGRNMFTNLLAAGAHHLKIHDPQRR